MDSKKSLRWVDEKDYIVVRKKLRALAQFEHSEYQVLSVPLLRVVLATLEFWHDYAVELEDG